MKNNCAHLENISPSHRNWDALVSTYLPEKLSLLLERMETPIPAKDFLRRGSGIEYLKSKYPQLGNEFSGCYVLTQNSKPVYVGISRKVIRRLFILFRGHVHRSSTLANMIINEKFPMPGTWYENMQNSEFRKEYSQITEEIQKYNVGMVEISGDMELHLFSIYCAQKLNIPLINHFRIN